MKFSRVFRFFLLVSVCMFVTSISIFADTSSPVIDVNSISISQPTATVGDNVTISVKITDDVKVSRAIISLHNGEAHNLISNKSMIYNEQLDVFEYTFKITDTVPNGLWTISSIGAYDESGNYNGCYSYSIPDSKNVLVHGTAADSEPPVILENSITINKNVASVGDLVKVSFKVIDNIAVKYVSVQFKNLEQGQLNTTSSVNYNVDTGMYECSFLVNSSVLPGTWEVNQIYATDTQSNYTFLYPEETFLVEPQNEDLSEVEQETIRLLTFDNSKIEVNYPNKNSVVSIVSSDENVVSHEFKGVSWTYSSGNSFYTNIYELTGKSVGEARILVKVGGITVKIYNVIVSMREESQSGHYKDEYLLSYSGSSYDDLFIEGDNIESDINKIEEKTSYTISIGSTHMTIETVNYKYNIKLKFNSIGKQIATVKSTTLGDLVKINADIYGNGWRLIDGYWKYYNNNGLMVTGWQKINGVWYYFDDDHSMVTGWHNVYGTWYYFNKEGAMVTGWIKINGRWYYLNQEGAMAVGLQTINGTKYYFSNDGVMVTGWQLIDGIWYYFNNDGAMVIGWLNISDKWYYFAGDGKMVTRWQMIDGAWYYFNDNGDMHTGWLYDYNREYYLRGDGIMLTGWQTLNGVTYYFKSTGEMAKDEWCNGWLLNWDGAWTYPYRASWHYVNGHWRYEDDHGWYANCNTYVIDGVYYTFDSNGWMQ